MSQASRIRRFLPVLVVVGIVALVISAVRLPVMGKPHAREAGAPASELQTTVDQINTIFAEKWRAAGIRPAELASELQIFRRLSLALHGSIPSLEEIREFETDRREDRLAHWTRRILADSRYSDYFAERLARSYVGKEDGQFVIFRRDRFLEWLSGHLKRRTPYDHLVREMIADTGLMTGKPAVNFITAAFANDEIDENKLAGKTVRAFLGQRIDCAQCHDHPFDHWKQNEFEGLAAFYGQARQTIVGLEDKMQVDGKPVEFEVEDRKTREKRIVTPGVPFHPEWMPATGSRREQLAAWITHPENRRFERAIANRVWALMFGRAFIEPVDDLRDPPETPDLLDVLGRDFREHGCDLTRLIQVIAASNPYRISSEWDERYSNTPNADPEEELKRAEQEWASFPLIRLRPEQVIGSILQSSSIQTIDQNSQLFFRTLKLLRQAEFVREYGDLGENELQDRGGTIPQRLLLMNGKLASEAIAPSPINASARIAALAKTSEKQIEAAYLVCLTRRPTSEEQAWFASQLAGQTGKQPRQQAIEDLLWSLLNSTEFSWNH